MDEDKTEQQTDDLAAIDPDGYEALTSTTKATIDRCMVLARKRASEAQAEPEKVAEQVLAEIGQPEPEQQNFPFAPLPTDMCRVSPFFPLAAIKKKGVRPFIKSLAISVSSWGKIEYIGPQLSVEDEDVLIVLLALIDTEKRLCIDKKSGKTSYSYIGPMRPLFKLLGYKNNPGENDYNRVRQSLEYMAVSGLKMTINKKNTRGKPKAEKVTMTNMISYYDYDSKGQTLAVVVNPYFYEVYIRGNVTLLDVAARSQLRAPTSKAILRFMQSHRDAKWCGHFQTLASSINLEVDKPDFKKRSQLKTAIADLKKHGFLGEKSNISGDIVTLYRSPKIGTRKKVSQR